mgnify:FL=1
MGQYRAVMDKQELNATRTARQAKIHKALLITHQREDRYR